MTFENDYSAAYSIPGMKADAQDPLRADTVIDIVCKYFDIKRSEIFKKCRKKEIVYVRQICIYLLIDYKLLNVSEIGRLFNQHHATIIYARDEIKSKIFARAYNTYKNDYYNLLKRI